MGTKCSPDAKNLHDGYTCLPFGGDGNYDELVGYQCQSEHGRERDKGGEAQHLPKYIFSVAWHRKRFRPGQAETLR